MNEPLDSSHPALEQIDNDWRIRFRRRILPWFRKHARDLPWRQTTDPYAIWVSEIMLQQTQVATVIGFYEKFLARFPDVRSLADADETEVLRNWEGLGYYRRARQMRAAAIVICERFDGVFPTEFDDVLALPGIGRYTAGAILSFSQNQRLPIVEANTIRLYARLIALRGDVAATDSLNCLWEFAELILPRRNCGDFNQALMEIGSLVCTPKDPDCESCPARNLCFTRIAGLQREIPRKKKRQKFKQLAESVLVVKNRGKLLMRVCGTDEWWAGLWDFPRYRVATDDIAGLEESFRSQTGLNVSAGDLLFRIKHTVTNHNITLSCFAANVTAGKLGTFANSKESKFCWVSNSELDEFPLCVTARKIVKRIGL